MSSLHLTYRDLLIKVSADTEADLIWLQDFLGPSYRSVEAAADSNALEIALQSDPGWVERRQGWPQAEAETPLPSLLAYVLDGTDLHLPYQHLPDGSLLAWDHQFECFIHRDAHGGTTLLHAPGKPAPRRPRLALMRAVREAVMHHELRRSSLALHASGLEREGAAVLFAGPRQAGKTTLLSACLSLLPGLNLLANDRVMLTPQMDGWHCRGMATIVSVRAGDEGLLPGLRQRLHDHTLGPEAGEGEPMAREFPASGRLYLSPTQYCRSLGVGMAPESRVAGIVLPRIEPTASGLHCRRIAPEEASLPVAEALFGAAHPHSRSQLFDTPESGPFPGQAERLALVQRLVRQVPCFNLVVGAEAYRPEKLCTLLNDVFRGN